MGHDEPLWRRAATHTLHASLILKASLEERLQRDTSLLLADHEALNHLRHGPLRMSDIADALILSRGGTTKVIDRLEEMGYARRRPDPDDRRATIVEITASGIEAATAGRAVVDDELEQMWATHLTDAEAETLIAIMRRVVADRRL